MVTLTWTRQRDGSGTLYRGVPSDGSPDWIVRNYSGGDDPWGAGPEERIEGVSMFWGSTMEEAKLAAAVTLNGGNPDEHSTRCHFTRNSVPPRGSWTNIWKWSCSCGAKSSGGNDRAGAHAGALNHRLDAMDAFLRGGEQS